MSSVVLPFPHRGIKISPSSCFSIDEQQMSTTEKNGTAIPNGGLSITSASLRPSHPLAYVLCLLSLNGGSLKEWD
jgi:hypothetical protein